MKAEERSIGALLTALLALGLLAVAATAVWFEYDFTTGRQTPPGGPQPEDITGVEREELDFYADRWQGDIEPADAEQAAQAVGLIQKGIYAAAAALGVAVLAEIPGIASLLRRRVALVFLAAAFVSVAGIVGIAWYWLPESLAAYGVQGPYTARLDEPDGYTRTSMSTGWYAAALAMATVFAAFLFKFQAGRIDSAMVEQLAK